MALVKVAKLTPAQPGVARFAATCACAKVTILYVPVAHMGPGSVGGYRCDGCGLEHRFAVTAHANGGPLS